MVATRILLSARRILGNATITIAVNVAADMQMSALPNAPTGAARAAFRPVPASLTEDGFLGGGSSILQPEKGYRAGIDAVFLAASIPCGRRNHVRGGHGHGRRRPLPRPRVRDACHRDRGRLPLCHAGEENAKRNECGQASRSSMPTSRKRCAASSPHMPAQGSFNHAFANPPYFEDGKSTPSPIC